MDIRPLTRYGLELSPLQKSDAEELLQAAATPETFRYMLKTPDWTVQGFRDYIAERSAPGFFPFACRMEGKIVGCSSIFDVDQTHRHLEIGYTWITPSKRATVVNPVMKLLMLEYAFEEFGAVRVQLKCDARNAQSRAAIEKLGAKFEGIWRNHMILENGDLRQTAFFSIVPEEWPEVKERLLERYRRLTKATT